VGANNLPRNQDELVGMDRDLFWGGDISLIQAMCGPDSSTFTSNELCHAVSVDAEVQRILGQRRRRVTTHSPSYSIRVA